MRQLNVNDIPLQAAATVNGQAIISQNIFAASASIVCTGAAAGTLQFQACNDDTQGPSNTSPTNWVNISGESVVVAGAGTYLIPKFDVCYEFIRVTYTNTGTGTISANIKMLGM